MKNIFKAEINDGIADLVANTSTIAFCSEIISTHQPTEEEYRSFASSVSSNFDSRDLFGLDAVLASVGWNKNDDIFDRYETWNARTTPEDKQFNFMHDEKDIIGHITKSYIMDYEGNRLDNSLSLSQLPELFEVVMGSVLYRTWSDENLKARMDSIIANITRDKTQASDEEDGDWHVSMECLFPAFDYMLIDQRGKAEIVKRNETSAFLTKHLRAYKGSGQYNGYKIGRLLRDFSFSGVGLVKNPANPRSVILNKTKAVYFKGNDMPENLDLDVLKNELAEAKKSYDEMKKKMEDAKAESEASVSSLSSQLAELQAALAAEKKEKEKMAEEVKAMKKEKTMMKRKAQLSEAGFASDEIDDTLNKFESLDDSIFDVIVATLKSKTEAAKAAAKKGMEEKEEKEEECKACRCASSSAKTKAEDEVDENEASAKVLDSAEQTKDVAMAENFEEEDIRAFASKWFSENVLKTTASIKE